MTTVTLTFNLPEEESEFQDALNGVKYKIAVDEIWDKVLRPARKNGYDDPLLDSDLATEVIEKLMKIYHEVTEDLPDE